MGFSPNRIFRKIKKKYNINRVSKNKLIKIYLYSPNLRFIKKKIVRIKLKKLLKKLSKKELTLLIWVDGLI